MQFDKLLQIVKDYKWLGGLILMFISSWYDIRGQVKDVAHEVKENRSVQEVINNNQIFRDGIQDQAIKDMQNNIHQELKEIQKKLDDPRRKY